MATNTRKLSDFLAEGEGDTFGDLAVVGEPHIKPGTLYPAWSGLLEDNTGHTFTDSSPSAHALTPTGQVHHSGVQEKVGSTSLKFDGSTAYLEAPASADWNFGSGDATIECWFYPTSSSGVQRILSSQSAGLWILWWNRNGNRKVSINGNVVTESHSSNAFSLNTWHHAAITKIGTAIKLYVNGVQEIAVTASGNFTDTSATMIAGAYSGDGSEKFNGYIDEIRICKGLAVYTGAFTPQTTALTTTWSAGTNIAANSTASNVKLLIHSDNGGHSGAYGTAQSDGRKYYYTEIRGSKPIKDPRIGAHFGSQRHKIKSLQKLEQETATHSQDVFSIDGREWMRCTGGGWSILNNGHGNRLVGGNVSSYPNMYIEIVGYFNGINTSAYTDSSHKFRYTLDGGNEVATDYGANSSGMLLSSGATRYISDAGSITNIPISTTLGIHTIKLRSSGAEHDVYGVELIAQDTTSTATKSQIQIPSQNVVSYGKKFSVSGTPHYNPFAQSQTGVAVTINSSTTNTAKLTGGWSGTGATYYSSELDTATSLGLSAWVSGGEYFRPVNGGRVVWWVNSSGSLKCSVNMMPPAGTAIGGVTSGHNVPTGVHNWATKYQPALYSTTIDHSQAEVAKTFVWREFGNGAANSAGSGTWKDSSMNNSNNDISYVMADGLTSLAGEDVTEAGNSLTVTGSGDHYFLTFIGIGIERREAGYGVRQEAQNLPYGTHILKVGYDGQVDVYIDGISIDSTSTSQAWETWELSIFQPKKPPIPEDAVVLADYMLMADFVNGAGGSGKISKGSRLVNSSRDFFYDETTNTSFSFLGPNTGYNPSGFAIANAANISSGTMSCQLPYFGTTANFRAQDPNSRLATITEYINSTSLGTRTNSGTGYNEIATHANSPTLGINGMKGADTSNDFWIDSVEIATPIHTSSHYQTFETPFLHEIVGGDRNMEQNNLVVTADGKTWDEVTRDTSYISDICVTTDTDSDYDWNNPRTVIFDEWRGPGTNASYRNNCNKDFAISYDRIICLVDGWYNIMTHNAYSNDADAHHYVFINGVSSLGAYQTATGGLLHNNYTVQLKRNDYIQVQGEWGMDASNYHLFQIRRVIG